VHLLGIQDVFNDYVVCIHGRANRDSAFDAIVLGDFVRPDEVTAVLWITKRLPAQSGK
jgi:hypothetical protein